VKTKVEIDNRQLLARMKRLEEVTGKQVTMTMRRSARLLAVSLAYSTPPYGANIDARKKGERAVQKDILKVMRPMENIRLPFPSKVESFKATVQRIVTNNKSLRKDLLKAIRDYDIARISGIIQHVPGFSQLNVIGLPDADLHQKTRNAYGRVSRGWKGRDIVFKSAYLKEYIEKKQQLVGLSKAPWAACALSINADVKNALSGIPAWVSRHLSKVPHNVLDASNALAPKITLTSKLPWADKVLNESKHKEAVRISREKFFNSMDREIRKALKEQTAA
jgi:hypothetical protein